MFNAEHNIKIQYTPEENARRLLVWSYKETLNSSQRCFGVRGYINKIKRRQDSRDGTTSISRTPPSDLGTDTLPEGGHWVTLSLTQESQWLTRCTYKGLHARLLCHAWRAAPYGLCEKGGVFKYTVFFVSLPSFLCSYWTGNISRNKQSYSFPVLNTSYWQHINLPRTSTTNET